jgi:hypothetical protein
MLQVGVRILILQMGVRIVMLWGDASEFVIMLSVGLLSDAL